MFFLHHWNILDNKETTHFLYYLYTFLSKKKVRELTLRHTNYINYKLNMNYLP